MHRGFSTTILALTAGIAVLVGVVGYITVNNQTNDGSGSVATTSRSTSTTGTGTSTSTKTDIPDSWQTYQNEEYGFVISYPGVYTDLTKMSSADHSALTFLQTKASQYPTLRVSVHNINDFSAGADTGGTWPRYYDPIKDQWVARAGNESKIVEKSPVFSTDGYSVYRFESGNIAGRKEVFAIPVEPRDMVVAISFVYDLDNSTESNKEENYTAHDVDKEEILKSFQIISEPVQPNHVNDGSEDGHKNSAEDFRFESADHNFSFQLPRIENTNLITEGDHLAAHHAISFVRSSGVGVRVSTTSLQSESIQGLQDSLDLNCAGVTESRDEQCWFITDETVVAGEPALQLERREENVKPTDRSRRTVFIRDGKRFTIYSRGGQRFNSAYQNILNTLEFVNVDETDVVNKEKWLGGKDAWQNYENKSLGFSLRYPEEVIKITEKSDDTVWIKERGTDGYFFSINVNDFSLERKITKDIDRRGSFVGKESEKIEGVPATKYTWEYDRNNCRSMAYIIRHNQTTYLIDDLVDCGGSDEYGSYERLRKVLSTLRITGNGPKDARTKKNQILENIERQYTEEFVSDPAFIKEASAVKGEGTFEVNANNRKPVDFVRWDHDSDGKKSLAVLNNAGNVPELILFSVDVDNKLSNPRRIDTLPDGTWVWRSAGLKLVNTYEGTFLRTKIRLGQSPPAMDYYSYRNRNFRERGDIKKYHTGKCEIGFVYPDSDAVFKQGETYEVRWKNPLSSGRKFDKITTLRVIDKNENVIGKINYGYSPGKGAEWQSLQVQELGSDLLTQGGKTPDPGKYKLRARLTYDKETRDEFLEKGCELVDDEKEGGHYENTFESGWFNVVN